MSALPGSGAITGKKNERGTSLRKNAGLAVGFALAVTLYESRDFAMIDVINAAVSKGAALAEWAGVRGFAREEVMAIGDNWNDREMLEFAGVPVIMGNCVAELQAQGWHLTLSNDAHGVAHAIRKFAFNGGGR